MMNLVVVLSTWVDTLQMSMLATCNASLPVGRVDNLLAAKEHLRALSTRIQTVVTEAIRQGATTALADA
jgi:hypothetical protein